MSIGSAMNVAYSPKELHTYLREATQVSSEYPVVITRFYTGYREVEMDAVANEGQVSYFSVKHRQKYLSLYPSGQWVGIIYYRNINSAYKRAYNFMKICKSSVICTPYMWMGV